MSLITLVALPNGLPAVPVVTAEFDFLVGRWTVRNRRLRAPFSGWDEWYETPAEAVSRTQHGGAISIDEMWFPTEGFAATSIRTRRSDGTWTVYGVDSRCGQVQPPVSGRWTADGTQFDALGRDEVDGRAILTRSQWHSITPETATWERALSVDDGLTWETTWVMAWTRLHDGQ